MKKYTIEELLDDALDTSNGTYFEIVQAFDGVKVSPQNEEKWYSLIYNYIDEYNEAAYYWDRAPANLNNKIIKPIIINKLKENICTTSEGIKYYRMLDWPTDTEDLVDSPSFYSHE